MPTIDLIVAATDFSKASETAMTYAKSMALRYGAALRIVHVAEDVAAMYANVEGPVPDLEGLQQQAEQDDERELAKTVTREDRQILDVRPVMLSSAPVAAAIVEYARGQRAGLIVMGTHGRTGIARLLLGSVAEHVIRLADCPVLTVRTPADPSDEAVGVEERELAGVA